MNDYVEVRLDAEPCNETITDLLAALLAERGFESFVPDDSGLTAFAPASAFDPQAVAEAIDALPFEGLTVVETSVERVEGRDWNAEWERNYFKPIVIDGRCVIHSTFHTDIPGADYDIVIDPKMAFGTGHHQTTSLIVGRLLDADLEGRNVIDMGTGTAILAILAAMRGAKSVTAIEIDPFAAINARENVSLNGVADKVTVVDGDASALTEAPVKADWFLANINRNVIVADMARYVAALAPGATIVFSGFYREDRPIIEAEALRLGLTPGVETSRDNWCCLSYTL